MTIGSIFLGLALLVVIGLFVTRPLFFRDPHPRRRMCERQALLAQKEAVLVEIRSLDFDYETGKVLEVDYQEQREAYIEQATDLLMRIDQLDEAFLEAAGEPDPDLQAKPEYDAIEAAIARRRAKTKAVSEPDAPIPARENGHSHFCPQCGQPADAGDRFCAHCGHQLAHPQHA
ncbi:MAG: zinc ribbon domain-containing protein [Chloroflexota bacterium]|nr:MAG: zinc ribbon domain-containing protein [Chloroflexota bacterium]